MVSVEPGRKISYSQFVFTPVVSCQVKLGEKSDDFSEELTEKGQRHKTLVALSYLLTEFKQFADKTLVCDYSKQQNFTQNISLWNGIATRM